MFMIIYILKCVQQFFYQLLFKIYNESCPIRTKILTRANLHEPWFDDELKELSKLKHHLSQQYKNHIIDYEQYRNFNDGSTALLKRTKTLYFHEKFLSCMGDLRKTCRNINSIIDPKTKRIISEIVENGVTHNCNMDIAKKCNQYFVSIASSLRDGLPSNATSYTSYMGERSSQAIIYEPVTAEEIINLINKLNYNNIH